MTRLSLVVFYFTLSLHFTSGLQSPVRISPSVCILFPVCSLQSAFYTDRLTRDFTTPLRKSKVKTVINNDGKFSEIKHGTYLILKF